MAMLRTWNSFGDRNPITECNGSICRRYGARWAYYSRKSVKILAPADALQSYERGRARCFDHCRRCAA
jgi:hypothetical protein